MKIFRVFIYLFIYFYILGCDSSNKNDCPYFNEIEKYFKVVHNIEILDSKKEYLYYLIDLEGCESCSNQNMDMLLNLKKNKILSLVFVGKNDNLILLEKTNKLKMKFKYLIDYEKKIFEYQTNISMGPVFIHTKNNSCLTVYAVTDYQIMSTKSYIENAY